MKSLNVPKQLTQNAKRVAAIAVLVVTLFLFGYYIHQHPHILDGLHQLSTFIIALLLFLFALVLATNAYILHWSVQLCSRSISYFETLLLTSYSSLVNFFGPLQSGPGFRALYLKRKHDVSLKSYTSATLLYYGLFGFTNLLFLLFGLPRNLALILLAVLVVGAVVGFRLLSKRVGLIKHPTEIAHIAIMTMLQVGIMAMVYFVELHTVNHSISLSQTLVYTGAANLALFVSLTPGALGIRESFLYFSQDLHHISTANIVSASIIDRGVYFILLGLLFAFTAIFHIQDRLKSSSAAKD
ncbi:hypothetical protein BH09PAT4_BH09PAT4_03030 [soil metagenome]